MSILHCLCPSMYYELDQSYIKIVLSYRKPCVGSNDIASARQALQSLLFSYKTMVAAGNSAQQLYIYSIE